MAVLTELKGRDKLIGQLMAAYERMLSEPGPRMIEITGLPGIGKTKLLQGFYEELRAKHGGGYWREAFIGRRTRSIAPKPRFEKDRPFMPYFWWGLSCDESNKDSKDSLQPFFGGAEQFIAAVTLPVIEKSQFSCKEAWREFYWKTGKSVLTAIAAVFPYANIALAIGIEYEAIVELRNSLRRLDEDKRGPAMASVTEIAGEKSAEDVYFELLNRFLGDEGSTARKLPIVLVIDDCQYLDERSYSFLRRLLVIAENQHWPLLIIMASRSDEDHELLTKLVEGADRYSSEHEFQYHLDEDVNQLKEMAVADILRLNLEIKREQTPGKLDYITISPSETTIGKLASKTGKNPLYIENYALLVVADHNWMDNDGNLTCTEDDLNEIPRGIEALIDTRLRIMGEDILKCKALHWGSVQGRRFIKDLVIRLDDGISTEEDMNMAFDDLVNKHRFLAHVDGLPDHIRFFEFTHQVNHACLYKRISVRREELKRVEHTLCVLLRDWTANETIKEWPTAELLDGSIRLSNYANKQKDIVCDDNQEEWLKAELVSGSTALRIMHIKGNNRESKSLSFQLLGSLQSTDTDQAKHLYNVLFDLSESLLDVLQILAEWDSCILCQNIMITISDDEYSKAGYEQNIGVIYALRGDYTKALDYFHRSYSVIEQISDEADKANILLNIGAVYSNLSDYKRALSYLNRSLEIARLHCDEHVIASIQCNIALTHKSQSNYEQALKLYRNSLEIFNRIGAVHDYSMTLNNIGTIFRSLGEYDKALEFYSSSLEIKTRLGDVRGIAIVKNNIGNVHLLKNETHLALESLEDSYRIYKLIEYEPGKSKSLQNIGNVYFSTGNYDQALNHFHKSLKAIKRTNELTGEAQILGSIGNVYTSIGDYDLALKYYTESLEIDKQIGNRGGMAQTFLNIGNTYGSKGETDNAINNFQCSIELMKLTKNIHGESCVNLAIGILLINANNVLEARPFLTKALPVFQQLDDKRQVAYTLQALDAIDGAIANAYKNWKPST